MPRTLKTALLTMRELALSGGPLLLLAVGLLVAAFWWLDPNPPRRVVLATGPEQSAYAEFGKRYAAQLKSSGIEVVLRPSQGSSNNLALLRAGEVDLAFVQGSRLPPDDESDAPLLSLGSLFVEPVWLFYRAAAARHLNPAATLQSLAQLKGWRVNVGSVGSGLPDLMDQLLAANRMEPAALRRSMLEQTAATVAFLGGELDALVFASAPESPMVQMLLQTPGVKLFDFVQNEAYSRRLPFLAPVMLPRGVVDLAADIPGKSVHLVAPTTTLLARETTHPAILQLASQASLTIHGQAGWFSRTREFPNLGSTGFAPSKEAERTIRGGIPLLQRYLPFSVANLMERMWLALGLIIAVLLPLSRIVPPLYDFRMRSRVFRWYGQLRDIEERAGQAADAANLMHELVELERKVGQVVVPLSYTDDLYSLRNHIDMVRQKLLRV